jgi:hypothetical protein
MQAYVRNLPVSWAFPPNIRRFGHQNRKWKRQVSQQPNGGQLDTLAQPRASHPPAAGRSSPEALRGNDRVMHARLVHMGYPDDAGAAQLDHSGDRRRTRRDHGVPSRLEIITWSSATSAAPTPIRCASVMQANASIDFPPARWADKKQPGLANDDRRRMDINRCCAHDAGSAGRARVKRAPTTASVSASMMFSAFSEPPWASAICRLIERPRPEFWPKPSASGRSV